MCKVYEYVYDGCGHKHLKSTPCKRTKTYINRAGAVIPRCSGGTITITSGVLGGANKACVGGKDTLTIHYDKSCLSCVKDGILKQKAEKVVEMEERFGALAEESLYAQTRIDSAMEEYRYYEERLDREIPLKRPLGTYINEAKLTCKVESVEKREARKARKEAKRKREKEEIEALVDILAPYFEDDEEEEEEPPAKKAKLMLRVRPKLTPKPDSSYPQRLVADQDVDGVIGGGDGLRRSGRATKLTWKLR